MTKRNYTLIELLTVIFIIAVLAGLIIPATAMVRGRAKRLNCASNLKQVGALCMQFSNDRDGQIPMYKYEHKTTPENAQLQYRRNALVFLRSILECENCNINAKKYFNTDGFSYQDHNYNRKHALVNELLTVAPKIGISYGYAKSNDPATKYIVYFDLPMTGDQVSFHSDIDKDRIKSVPVYDKEWDQLVNSSLRKIEKSFCIMFGEELKKKYKIPT